MSRLPLKERIRKGVFLLDGAMGTELIARGVEAGTCNDYLNVEAPDIVIDVHRSYFEAGSDAVLTNTFGANKYALARHGLSESVSKVNENGAKIARQAAGEDKYVLGDIGPSGDFLEPLGTLRVDDLRDTFAEQAKALESGGVDGFIIETMTAIDEVRIAIEAVKSVSDLPILASMSFDRAGNDFRTMMGVNVDSAVAAIAPLGVDAVGFNCGTLSLDSYIELAKKYVSVIQALEKKRATGHPSSEAELLRRTGESRITLLAEPNAGKPELIDGKAIYKVTPEDFAEAAEKIYSTGVTIIGGCCGTGPEHIKAMAEKLKRNNNFC